MKADTPYSEAAFYAIGRQLAQMRKGMLEEGMDPESADGLLTVYFMAIVNRRPMEEAE